MRLTRTFKFSGALTLLGVGLSTAGSWGVQEDLLTPLGVVLLIFAGPVFAASALRHLLRGLLWRVGSRLFVSYLLIGVVPLPFLLALLYLGVWILSGQLGARRAETAVLRRLAQLHAVARELGSACDAGPCPELAAALGRRHVQELPGLAFSGAGESPGATEGPLGPAGLGSGSWAQGRDEELLARRDGRLFLAAAVPLASGPLIAWQPLDASLREALERETGLKLRFREARFETPRASGTAKKPRWRVTSQSGGGSAHIELGDPDFFADPAGTPPPGFLERRWVTWMGALDRPLVDAATGQALPSQRLVFVLRTSVAAELRELFARSRFGGDARLEAGVIVKRIMQCLAAFTLGVYVVASLLAGLLVLRIARAARRLSRAFSEVERGGFGAQAQLGGHDQLAGLVDGFNQMSARLKESVAARAEREALEHELQLARDLQRRLLPAADFAFPGLEIAVDFRPAAAIGGDFYHFVAEGEDRLVVVIADVSGHGLSTGIVMASAKASLSALAATGAGTAEIFATLDREIRTTTDSRTFVTLAHTRFRLREAELDFTNAGHIYPYRVELTGAVSSLANPARPLGVTLAGGFRTVTAPFRPGDLWVFLSDGIVEAMDPAGEVFGFERLERELAAGAGGPASALRDHILTTWVAFTSREEPADDRTLIVVRIEG